MHVIIIFIQTQLTQPPPKKQDFNLLSKHSMHVIVIFLQTQLTQPPNKLDLNLLSKHSLTISTESKIWLRLTKGFWELHTTFSNTILNLFANILAKTL